MSNAKALLVIDIQNDYFPGGKYPQWNTDNVLDNIVSVINKAHNHEIPVFLIQHIADPGLGLAPFFNADTEGAALHPRLMAVAPDAPVITKHYADAFVDTRLQTELSAYPIEKLLICGMMTQNCVTFTALSRMAEQYAVSVLTDCCTTVDEMLHNIALHALSTRVNLMQSADAF